MDRTASLRNKFTRTPALSSAMRERYRSDRFQLRMGTRRRMLCTCGTRFHDNPGPMLHNHLWERVARYKLELLCDPCVRRRLGRPFTRWDLRDCPFNFGPDPNWRGPAPHGTTIVWWGYYPEPLELLRDLGVTV